MPFRLAFPFSLKENWQGTNLFRVEENEFFYHACAKFLA
jgi:hypothetical protein